MISNIELTKSKRRFSGCTSTHLPRYYFCTRCMSNTMVYRVVEGKRDLICIREECGKVNHV